MGLEGYKNVDLGRFLPAVGQLSLAHKQEDRRFHGPIAATGPGADWHYITATLKRSLGQMRGKMAGFRNPGET